MAPKSWRCSKSPTGVHYWIIEADDSSQTCKFCQELKVLDTSPKIKVYADLVPWTFTEVSEQ